MSAEVSRAVFLDRDGVLIEDRNRVLSSSELLLLPGVPEALCRLGGWKLAVVTNQPVVARGLLGEDQLAQIHAAMLQKIVDAGGPFLDGVWACPHHPHADLPAYRRRCDCRKPEPGLLFQASRSLKVALGPSWLVGDRPSDIAAGRRAGCRTILLETGKHLDTPIVGAESLGDEGIPHFRARNLMQAVERILETP